MKINDLKQQQKDDYIKNNSLEQSYIETKVLWQCKPLLPEVKIVGKDENNNIIFFEETSGSLQKRHYGKFEKANSYNLLVNNGNETKKITKQYLNQAVINFNKGYDMELLLNFIENNNPCFNALDCEKKNSYRFSLSDKEYLIVKEFIDKMRKYRGKNEI